MKKSSTSFVCQECGYESPKYLGKCPECGEWNTLKEFRIQNSELRITGQKKSSIAPKTLSQISSSEKGRVLTGFTEMDGVLGGGIVSGSVTLLAGDPGIGKSTLLLQMALNIAQGRGPAAPSSHPTSSPPAGGLRALPGTPSGRVTPRKVLYVSGEESEEQVKLRAERLLQNKKNPENFFLVSSTDVDSIVYLVEQEKPSFVVVDSIQTVQSEHAGGLAGAVGQIRYATSVLVRVAKTLNIPIVIVGHVTKEGMVAGPMVLSHMVDVVLFLEGEKQSNNRILRSFKNRFGPVDEVGVFQMQGEGMRELSEIENLFLSEETKQAPGSILTAIMEGSRVFLVEMQALVVPSKLPIPRHVVSGVDLKRVELLLAVLQKNTKLSLASYDIFVNAVGGVKITDPASDLAICLALLSSFRNKPFPKTVAISEVGLLGELRPVSYLEKRKKEAAKRGYRHIFGSEQKTLSNVIAIM